MVVSALLAQNHFLQSIEKALEGSLLRRLNRINLCYHNTTGECAMLCQSVPTLRWDQKIFQSWGVNTVNRPCGDTHKSTYLLPAVTVNVTVAEKNLLVRIWDRPYCVADFTFQTNETVNLLVQFPFQLIYSYNCSCKGCFGRMRTADTLSDGWASDVHCQRSELVQFLQVGVDSFIQSVRLIKIFFLLHISLYIRCRRRILFIRFLLLSSG